MSLPIFFGSSGCPECTLQKKLLKNKLKQNVDYYYYDLDKLPVPEMIIDKSGSYIMPTWWIPKKVINRKPHGVIVKGVTEIKRIKNNNFKSTKFGNSNSNWFIATPTWESTVREKYGGDGLMSIPFGGKFNNDTVDSIFEREYYLAPGGNRPNGDLITYLALNRACNNRNTPGKYQGLLKGEYPEIVDFNTY